MKRGLVAVLGAGGTIAPALVHDLAEARDVGELRLLDLDVERATDVAERHGLGKADVVGVNAGRSDELADALKGADVLVNSASYGLNLSAMEAALAAGATISTSAACTTSRGASSSCTSASAPPGCWRCSASVPARARRT